MSPTRSEELKHKKEPLDNEVDDDEMLCVRGGSPPTSASLNPTLIRESSIQREHYTDSDDSVYSYDSYGSQNKGYNKQAHSHKSTKKKHKRTEHKHRGGKRHDHKKHRSYENDSDGVSNQ